ncbi:MAG: 2,3-bisphosphoglycerate-independent phosphoglycerate mutase [Oscillospiraceae bacterium]|jgi:2,3-bisphosphoglycerate-independent phosphoglycerate mutase|nr:2,3-bisphosphoglycerate-independent phosphoglycerate mutase [Oscillospiraceae bacterium]
MKKTTLLMILDGFGHNPDSYGNAVSRANTPNLDRLIQSCPNTLIGASGMDVGLPEGQMGNSEVGHTNIGAGRIVYQELTRITKAIADGDFFENSAFLEAVENCKRKGGALHLMGLLSDGGVHSHNTHLYALLELAKSHGLQRVFIHCFMDGRDVPPDSGRGFMAELISKTEEIGAGKIATIMGRYYAMDRDKRWDRVIKAYSAMVHGEGVLNSDPLDVMAKSYEAGVTDEFVLPSVCTQDGMIREDDSVIFFNFRPDRAREITRALVDPDFEGFTRKGFFRLCWVCMTQYDSSMPNVLTAYRPQSLGNTLGKYISSLGMNQLRIAETEKYAHVTFFFNGGVEQPDECEDRALIPSPRVATYDLQPQMSAAEVTDELIARLETGKYDLIILNYANCDMVGHTGVYEAAVRAVEAVDGCVGRVIEKLLALGGQALITADHGNADKMYEPDGAPFTAHTTNPVPLIAVGTKGCGLAPLGEGRLADLAPTLLEMMSLEKPSEMTGKSLLRQQPSS